MNFTTFICRLAALAGALSFAPTTHAAPPAAAASRWAIVHAQIHVGDGTVINDGTVIVDQEKIARVGGPELASQLPSGSKTIDAKGQWLTPGLIAADSTIGLVEILYESTTNDLPGDHAGVILPSFEPSASIRLESSPIAVAAVAGFTGAIVGNESGLFAGQMSFVNLRPGGDRQALVRPSVAQRATLGALDSGSRVENLQLIRQVLDDARFYLRNKAAFDRGQSRDLKAHPVDLAALEPVLNRRVPLVVQAQRASDLLNALALAREYNLDLVLVGAAEGWVVANEIAKAKVPVLVQPTQNLPESFSHLNARLDNAALLHRAGVTLLLADVESAHMVPTIKQEAGIAVAGGVPHEVALTALTLNVAKAFKLDRDVGSIAAGKFADLVLWSGDPFEFSTAAQAVYVRGTAITMQSRQTLLRDRYRDLRKYRP